MYINILPPRHPKQLKCAKKNQENSEHFISGNKKNSDIASGPSEQRNKWKAERARDTGVLEQNRRDKV